VTRTSVMYFERLKRNKLHNKTNSYIMLLWYSGASRPTPSCHGQCLTYVATPQFAALQQQRLHWPNNPMNFSNGICRSQVPSLPPLDCTYDTVCPRLLTPLTDQRLEYSRRLGRLSKVWWRFQPLVSCIFHLRTQWRLEMKTQSTMCRKISPLFIFLITRRKINEC